MDQFTGVQVFTSTKREERDRLGERVTEWLTRNDVTIIDKVVMQPATQVRIAPTRIPEHARVRLARLARRGAEVCGRHGAPLLAEMAQALEIALLDIASGELRAGNAESRARRAERDLAAACAELRVARATIAELQVDLASRVHAEFSEPTAARPAPELIARCRP